MNSPGIGLKALLLRSGFGGCGKAANGVGSNFGHGDNGVPLFERFFVGGPLTVRGFQRNVEPDNVN